MIAVVVGTGMVSFSLCDLLDAGRQDSGPAGVVMALLGLVAGILTLREPAHSLIVMTVTVGLLLRFA